MTHHGTEIIRHLYTESKIYGYTRFSYVILSTVPGGVNFGVVIDKSNKYSRFGDYQYELPSVCSAFLADLSLRQWQVIVLNDGSQSGESMNMNNMFLNFSTGVALKVVYEDKVYNVYINDSFCGTLGSGLNSFGIFVQDSGSGTTTIRDFTVE